MTGEKSRAQPRAVQSEALFPGSHGAPGVDSVGTVYCWVVSAGERVGVRVDSKLLTCTFPGTVDLKDPYQVASGAVVFREWGIVVFVCFALCVCVGGG